MPPLSVDSRALGPDGACGAAEDRVQVERIGIENRRRQSMATLTVLKFPTADGADKMLGMIESLQKQRLITIHDAAIVTWPAGKKKPKTRQLQSLAGSGALMGAFWGMLFGLLFFVPILGLAIGAGMGALMGSVADVGIDDNFIKQVRSRV